MEDNKVLHMRIGGNLGDILLEIAQNNILEGNIDKAFSTYTDSLHGFTNEYALMLLKNKAVLVVNEKDQTMDLKDNPKLIADNSHNILDWDFIINERNRNLNGLLSNINKTEKTFTKYYNGNIRDYNILEMMKRYYNDEEMKVMSGKANIAARICGHPECKICDKGSSNPLSVWTRLEGQVETYLADIDEYGESDMSYPPAKWEIILYLTVRYNKLIRMLYKEYANFENTYLFLVEYDFIKKLPFIEATIERIISTLVDFCDAGEGYYHPLCNEGLAKYKETLYGNILKTKYGNEFAKNGIIKKDILDGYDAGWLSPNGEFFGDNGDTSAMIHLNLAEQIFKGNNIYANRMDKDGVSEYGGSNSPDYWLESHGWVKIHHNDCYGSFIGKRGEAPTKDFPYAYIPTEIQIKMICNYADKFYGGKFKTEASCIGMKKNPEVTTYKVKQMDEFQLHKLFRV